METIYKGAKYSITVNSSVELRYRMVRLYAPATKTTLEFDIEDTGSTTKDGRKTYLCTLKKGATEGAPVGLYNLEIYDGDLGEMLHFQEHYARLVTTSKSL